MPRRIKRVIKKSGGKVIAHSHRLEMAGIEQAQISRSMFFKRPIEHFDAIETHECQWKRIGNRYQHHGKCRGVTGEAGPIRPDPAPAVEWGSTNTHPRGNALQSFSYSMKPGRDS